MGRFGQGDTDFNFLHLTGSGDQMDFRTGLFAIPFRMDKAIFDKGLMGFVKKRKNGHPEQLSVCISSNLRDHPIGIFDPVMHIEDKDPVISKLGNRLKHSGFSIPANEPERADYPFSLCRWR
jgi:hypothetical protein